MRRPLSASVVPLWIAARCEVHSSFFDRAGALYDSWRVFAKGLGAEPGGPPEFAGEMERRGYAADQLSRGDRTRIRWGLRLRLPT